MPAFDERDAEILLAILPKWQARTGPRVGDFVKMPDGEVRRFAHDWGDSMQPTWGDAGSFYLMNNGRLSMSGGLDSAIPMGRIRDTGETRDGACWFFHHGMSGAHRGVQAVVPCRVYEVEPATAAVEVV